MIWRYGLGQEGRWIRRAPADKNTPKTCLRHYVSALRRLWVASAGSVHMCVATKAPCLKMQQQQCNRRCAERCENLCLAQMSPCLQIAQWGGGVSDISHMDWHGWIGWIGLDWFGLDGLDG